MIADWTLVKTFPGVELGKHKCAGWAQWYIHIVSLPNAALVDYDDAYEAGLPEDLNDFTLDDVKTAIEIAWKFVPRFTD